MVKDPGLLLPPYASRRVLPEPLPIGGKNDGQEGRYENSDRRYGFPSFVPQINGGEEIFIPATKPPPFGENEKLIEIRYSHIYKLFSYYNKLFTSLGSAHV
jgi:hypothetical protein